jgi:hypothetical protein
MLRCGIKLLQRHTWYPNIYAIWNVRSVFVENLNTRICFIYMSA